MEQEGKIDQYIEDLKKLGLTDIVILTCDTEEGSVFASTGALRKGEDGTKWKRSNVPFTTCRKFKGLEADAVILVDVSRGAFLRKQLHTASRIAVLHWCLKGETRAENRVQHE